MITLKRALITLLLISSFTINAQGGVDEDEDPVTAPINSNMTILFVSGILIGVFLISNSKKIKNL
ncbi:hypothetical protein [uncultured Flavobacterium sp.]|uniref:hypothetical protein n=1 Tax=uncultured Flavobacterium sp. TaxID=165435 RepID=UPI0030EC3E78